MQQHTGHILLVGVPSGELAQQYFLNHILRAGVQLSVIVRPNLTINEDILPKLFKVITCDFTNISLCLFHAQQLHQQVQLDGVVAFVELALETAAVIKTTLGINGIDLMPTVLSKYKGMMREHLSTFCTDLALPYSRISNKDELKKFFLELSAPLIVKPVKGAGSMSITKVLKYDEIDALKIDFKAHEYIAELYIAGEYVYHVETLSNNGRHHVLCIGAQAFTNKNLPHNITSITIPVQDLSATLQQKIADKVSQLLSAIGVKNGIAHTEIKIFKDKVFIIESQMRVGGSGIWYIVNKFIPQIEMYSRVLANLPTTISNSYQSWPEDIYTSYLILPTQSGTITKINGIEQIRENPHVEKLELFIAEGTDLVYNPEFVTELGILILRGKTLAEIEQARATLQGALSFNYADGSIVYF